MCVYTYICIYIYIYIYINGKGQNCYIWYFNSQNWVEIWHDSTQEATKLVREELPYLSQVFIYNTYPENTVLRILYQNKREKQQKEPFDVAKALYVPDHSRARRF